MPLIPDLKDVPELSVVEPGEYDLRIISAKEKTAQNGRKGIQLTIDITEDDSALPVFENLWMPLDSEDEAKKATMWRMMKERLIALGLPTDESLELSDFANLEFTAILDIESDDQYGDRNVIKRIV